MRGLAIGRVMDNVCSPFHAQPGCCLLFIGQNCYAGGLTTGVYGLLPAAGAIPASTAIPGQLLRFDAALDNFPGSCCSHESTDFIKPGMMSGGLHCPGICSLSHVLRVGSGWAGQLMRGFQTCLSIPELLRAWALASEEAVEPQSSLAHGHTAQHEEPQEPLQGLLHCPASPPTWGWNRPIQKPLQNSPLVWTKQRRAGNKTEPTDFPGSASKA